MPTTQSIVRETSANTRLFIGGPLLGRLERLDEAGGLLVAARAVGQGKGGFAVGQRTARLRRRQGAEIRDRVGGRASQARLTAATGGPERVRPEDCLRLAQGGH